ncbi:MFS transporter [Streptomyces sp. ISL-36]|uniref:MFS transporter n=1 Tax=Streptomyces sp. ISL-36 TaxID=2819182 RepID=UPI001BE741A7|nr:MFS transporter [Streptomyces sp. ISL-36]MBT2444294.1 MFS transporter [Streptomyces sp. ISL-36]
MYRDTLSLLGPVLPVVSFLGRLPTAMCQLGSLLLVAETSGSLTTAGLAGGALAAGQTVAGPVIGRLADRRGQRGVVLAASLANAVAVAALVIAALGHAATGWLVLLGAFAGATVPQVGPLARTRSVALARRSGADDRLVGTVLSFEGTLDEVSFVLGPALVGLAAALAHPAAALLLAAALLATCGTAFALHPSAAAAEKTAVAQVAAAGETAGAAETVSVPKTRGTAGGTAARAAPRTATRTGAAVRARLPRSAHALRVTMVLQGAMFGASQAGITALTEKLGAPAQAGLVYAAMGVMSAVVGLSMAAVPARIGLPTRWRVATAALVVLSVPLVLVDSLAALYAVVIVLGAAYAPHLITVFGLTEGTVPATRLAESMAFLTSGIVGGQAVALALSGRLADSHGAPAAFAVAVGAAVACAVLSWTVRTGYRSQERATTPAVSAP